MEAYGVQGAGVGGKKHKRRTGEDSPRFFICITGGGDSSGQSAYCEAVDLASGAARVEHPDRWQGALAYSEGEHSGICAEEKFHEYRFLRLTYSQISLCGTDYRILHIEDCGIKYIYIFMRHGFLFYFRRKSFIIQSLVSSCEFVLTYAQFYICPIRKYVLKYFDKKHSKLYTEYNLEL